MELDLHKTKGSVFPKKKQEICLSVRYSSLLLSAFQVLRLKNIVHEGSEK